MSAKLSTYLRTYRLRAGLTQRDVSFLLSIKSGSTISKIEKDYRIPNVIILLSYCVLFRALPYDLVPGLLINVQNNIIQRAQLLIEQLNKKAEIPMVLHRINFLKDFLSKQERGAQ